MMVKSSQKREVLFKEVSAEIQLHGQSEHDTFYKALKAHSESKEESQHGDKEHAEIKKILNSLNKFSVGGY